MKTTVKMLVLLLALMMTLPIVSACKKSETGNESESTVQSTEETTQAPTEESTEQETEPLPQPKPDLDSLEMDWKGREYTVFTQVMESKYFWEIYREEYDPNREIWAAVYERSEELKNQYGILLREQQLANLSGDVMSIYEAADQTECDLVLYDAIQTAMLHGQMGHLADMMDTAYVDFTRSCWSPVTTESVTFGGKCFFNTGHLLLEDKSHYQFLAGNETLLWSKYTKDPPHFGDMIDNNTWTLETVLNLIRQYTEDIDDVNGISGGDVFGLISDDVSDFSAFCVGAGLTYSQKDASGYPVLTPPTARVIGAVDALVSALADESVGWYFSKTDSHEDAASAAKIFQSGRALFWSTTLSEFEQVGMPMDYQFLPYPKLDARQEDYRTPVDITFLPVFAIPANADLDFASFGLEALSEISTETTFYVYVETANDAFWYARYDYETVLINIFKNASYDAVEYMNYGDMNELLSFLVPTVEKNFVSALYPAYAKAAKPELQALKNAYEALG